MAKIQMDENEVQFRKGLIAGLIVRNVISLGASLYEAARLALKQLPAEARVTWTTIIDVDEILNEIWPEMQPAAHMWAAYLDLGLIPVESRSADVILDVMGQFNGDARALARFLVTSEEYLARINRDWPELACQDP